MYLLKHATGAPTNSIIEFTFHYVSIKTKFNDINIIVAFVFTFHYVSIKTKTRLSVRSIQNYLHSTMYLLKPVTLRNNHFLHTIYIPLCIY